MSKNPFSKLQSSLALDELLDQSSGAYHPQNWLLTYLDVFVLTVMLVITLIALSDFKTQQSPAAAQPSASIQQEKVPAAAIAKLVPKAQVPEPKTESDSKDSNKALPSAAPEISIAAAKMPVPDAAVKLAEIEPKQAEAKPIPPIQDAKPVSEVLAQQTPAETKPAVSTQQAENEKRLQEQLTKTIDEFNLNDAVHIHVKQGYAQVEIQDKVLFKSSQADLTSEGAAVLKRLTPLLKQAEGLILIEGHTDNLPIKTPQFPSNWELGSARATSVLHFLTSQQLDSSRMRATTYADTLPIADNSTSAGREKNRRVSILIKVSERNAE